MKTPLAILALTALAGAASAETINARFTGVSPGQSVTLRFNGHDLHTQAGAFNFLRDMANPGTLPGLSPTFQGFCIDLTEYVQVNHSYSWSTHPVADSPTSNAGAMGPTNAARLGRLFAQRYMGLAGASNQGQAYAAFQLAVWEIVFDDGLSLTSGSMRCIDAPDGTRSLAQAWLNTLGSGPVMSILTIDDEPGCAQGHQGYVMVPAPGAAAAFGLGALAVGRRRRR